MSEKKYEISMLKVVTPDVLKEHHEPIPRDIHTTARNSLIKMFRDSLALNDHKTPDENHHEMLEGEVVDDFQNVVDYITYLLLRLETKGIKLTEKA